MKKLLAPVAAAALLLAMVTTVFAWQATLTSDCAPDANSFAWKINLHNEPDYKIEFSFASNFSGSWTVDFGTSGEHTFTTPRGPERRSTSAGSVTTTPRALRQPTPTSARSRRSPSRSLLQWPRRWRSQSPRRRECQLTEQGGNTCPSAVQSVEAGTGTPAGQHPQHVAGRKRAQSAADHPLQPGAARLTRWAGVHQCQGRGPRQAVGQRPGSHRKTEWRFAPTPSLHARGAWCRRSDLNRHEVALTGF